MTTAYGLAAQGAAPMSFLVATGLLREAECARGEGVTAVRSGACVATLRAELKRLPGAFSGVVSFGLAGGLDPALRPGQVVVGLEAAGGERRRKADARLASALAEGLYSAGLHVTQGAVIGVDAPVMTAAAKAALRASSGAAAVDMESHVAADYAALRGLPFVALRVVSDPAERALPPLAARAVKPDGGVDIACVLRELARHPAQLGGLLLAGLDAGAAFSSLSRCRPLLGPLLRLALA